ncbi:Carboxypeptidase regulatory-like domain-containing protein [Actinopolymorpha cephalotaxi]|uniref:Carboxypeptidase regulatory-like domain-containing protein n=1 Tax=Actinopolymorpha cephalotaxi TaxID=504797 RepID=A0A1I2K5L8_9ACTN|nr:carboxypeptidase-like regulatory domain-containing protein [Actinopolymorpha cephalotaxi]NYH85960.1 hypothetical protein [Actinopolymorpha cephalotaxi]SFF61733.1 Carboxypeptidase regulatory-like domain-containing protein [Actinopolymorpha cephalotaxi]
MAFTARVDLAPAARRVRLSGQVRGATCDGVPGPLPGAVVAVDRGRDAWTLTTDATGEYVLWVPAGGQPSQVIVAADAYRPTAFDVTLRGEDVRRDVTLPNLSCRPAARAGHGSGSGGGPVMARPTRLVVTGGRSITFDLYSAASRIRGADPMSAAESKESP